jgi:hypothetical protein
MKHIYHFLAIIGTTLLFIFSNPTYGQGVTCAGADPFCTVDGYTFPNTTGVTAEGGNNYGCLGTQPNPAWYYMEIATVGPITIGILFYMDRLQIYQLLLLIVVIWGFQQEK